MTCPIPPTPRQHLGMEWLWRSERTFTFWRHPRQCWLGEFLNRAIPFD